MKIAIIGGSGKMGQWFARLLQKDGKDVVITGRNQAKLLKAKQELGVEVAPLAEAVKTADVVLLSVPIDNFEEVVQQVSPYTHREQAIIDITSVKVFPVEVMHRHIKTGTVLGAHPMFGPGARDIARQNFILTPTSAAESALAQKVSGYLVTRGARTTVMTPPEHDEVMTVTLGLAHFIAIVSADTLLSFNRWKEMQALGGSSYKLLLTLAEGVVSQETESYASLQMHLPNLVRIEQQFQKTAQTWVDLVASGDKKKFTERMIVLKDSLARSDPDFGKAYQNMYRIVEELNL